MAAAAKERDLAFVPTFGLRLPRILGAFSALSFYLKYGKHASACRSNIFNLSRRAHRAELHARCV